MRGVLFALAATTAFLPAAGCTTAQLQNGAAIAAEVCQVVNANGPQIVAVLDANGVPVSATNKTSTAISADCALVGGIQATVGALPTASVKLPAQTP